MKKKRVWLLWKSEQGKNGKLTKVPYQINGRKAESTNPSTWTTYEEVQKHRNSFDGIGFAFDGSILGIDLDHVMPNGKLLPHVQEFVDVCNTYTEISPSGDGLHVIFSLSEPLSLEAHSHKNADSTKYECYTTGRYFTFTGNQYNKHPRRSIDSEEAMLILSKLGYPWKNKTTSNADTHTSVSMLTDEQVMDIMSRAKNGEKVMRL